MGEKIKVAAMGIGAAITLPLLILNWTSGLIGGIWLAFNHEWSLLVAGALAMFFGNYFLAFLMLIGAAIAALAIKVRWAIFRYPLLVLAFVVNFSVIISWGVGIFSFAINRPHTNVWPYLLWGYAMATVPWASMAQGDRNEGTIMWVSATQFGAVAVMLSVLIGQGYQSDFGMQLSFIPAALLGFGSSYMMYRLAQS